MHASSMVESTADDHLTVDGDAMFVVGTDPEHAAGPSLSAADHQTVNGGTQWRLVCGAREGTGSMLGVSADDKHLRHRRR